MQIEKYSYQTIIRKNKSLKKEILIRLSFNLSISLGQVLSLFTHIIFLPFISTTQICDWYTKNYYLMT